jgi:hypothetical protein
MKPGLGDFEPFRRLCPGCREAMMWARTEPARTEWLPLDYPGADRGSFLAFPARLADGRTILVAQAVNRPNASKLRAGGWLLFTPHRLSCPFTDQWARLPKAMRPTPTDAEPDPVDTAEPEPDGLFVASDLTTRKG